MSRRFNKELVLRLSISSALAWMLLGCSDDNAFVYPMTQETPVVHAQKESAMAIAHGSAIAVQAAMIHEELEGSKAIDVDDMRSDNPDILAIASTSHEYSIEFSPSTDGQSWVLIGVAPGTTTIRLYRDGDEVGTVNAEVVEQVP